MTKSPANGRCLTCRHPERARIELLLAGGASKHAVGQKYGLHHLTLHRHWHNHMSDERKAALVMGPTERMALAAQVGEEAASVIDHYRATRAGLYQLYNAAIEAGDRTGGAMVAGRLTEVNNAIAKITGELSNSPLIQNNTVNFYGSPEFVTFQQDLVRVLNRFPDAREAVLAEFERLEAETVPALEHRPDAVVAVA
jgi:hypothetical protein